MRRDNAYREVVIKVGVKLIMGHRQEGKTSYLLQWLWRHREDRVALFVPREMQKKRILKETEEELDVYNGSSYYNVGGKHFDYTAIDDLWQFRKPKTIIKEVGKITTTEMKCIIGAEIFDVTTLEEIRA